MKHIVDIHAKENPLHYAVPNTGCILEIPPELYIPVEDLEVGLAVGGGAGGIVKAGTYGATKVAIKHIPTIIYANEANEVNSMFVRECQILSGLHHPQIATFFGFSYTTDHFMLVQEFCGGGDLRGAFKNSPVTARKNAHRYVAEIASAMKHLHQKKVVHRDMKPENVLLSSDDINVAACKVCDFGCSKLVSEQGAATAMTKGLGTLHYLAPELLQFMHSSQATPERVPQEELNGFKMDVYACAIIFAECFQPEYALYKEYRSLAIVKGVMNSSLRPRLPPSLIPGAPELRLIQNMWDADPEMRPNFAAIVTTWEAIRDVK
jgi:serine/threonine protein kinase